MEAGSLGIGTSLVSRAGPLLSVQGVSWHRAQAQVGQSLLAGQPYTVYNLTVEADHTFFVGSAGGGTWVHNTCFSRPSGFRNGVREDTWENAKDPLTGEVRDPVSSDVMDANEPWDMGHKPGYEFRKHVSSAEERGLSRKEFLNEHNDPSHFRPELPGSNRGHSGEGPPGLNFWP